jgi:hypothetical protein
MIARVCGVSARRRAIEVQRIVDLGTIGTAPGGVTATPSTPRCSRA